MMKTRAVLLLFAVLLLLVPTVCVSATADPRRYVAAGDTRIAIIRIPPGRFLMGTNEAIHADDSWKPCASCPPRNDAERPAHQVTITHEFWMGEFDVTQGQWQAVMGTNPSHSKESGPDAPVERVSWNDVQQFLGKVNASQQEWMVRLPTEAEWEYAARAGTTTETYGPLDDIAWYRGNGGGKTHRAGEKRPNAFGLYDMLGNVWQWCSDWFGPYPSATAVDPTGPESGDKRIDRGGCYYCDAIHERASRRNRDTVEHASPSIGFRIVAVPKR